MLNCKETKFIVFMRIIHHIFPFLLGAMKMSSYPAHMLNLPSQKDVRSVIYSTEKICNEDCPSTSLSGNATCNIKYYVGWKNLVRYPFSYSVLRKCWVQYV